MNELKGVVFKKLKPFEARFCRRTWNVIKRILAEMAADECLILPGRVHTLKLRNLLINWCTPAKDDLEDISKSTRFQKSINVLVDDGLIEKKDIYHFKDTRTRTKVIRLVNFDQNFEPLIHPNMDEIKKFLAAMRKKGYIEKSDKYFERSEAKMLSPEELKAKEEVNLQEKLLKEEIQKIDPNASIKDLVEVAMLGGVKENKSDETPPPWVDALMEEIRLVRKDSNEAVAESITTREALGKVPKIICNFIKEQKSSDLNLKELMEQLTGFRQEVECRSKQLEQIAGSVEYYRQREFDLQNQLSEKDITITKQLEQIRLLEAEKAEQMVDLVKEKKARQDAETRLNQLRKSRAEAEKIREDTLKNRKVVFEGFEDA